MRVRLLVPASLDLPRGNVTSARRLQAGLASRGIESTVEWIPVSDGVDAASRPRREVGAAQDVTHVFNARYLGELIQADLVDAGRPIVVTLTGTDLNHDAAQTDSDTATTVWRALEAADGIVVYHHAALEQLLGYYPGAAGKAVVIPPAVWLPAETAEVDLDSGTSEPETDNVDSAHVDTIQAEGFVTLLLPAALRPVKDIERAIRVLTDVSKRYPSLRLVLAGPILDVEYGRRVLEAVQERPWVSYVGAVPLEGMSDLIRRSDIVLNTSLSEGLSNAVLEAMSLGKAVLASDIPGNRAAIRHGISGLLFGSDQAFSEMLEALILDPDLRNRLGRQAAAQVWQEFSLEAEVDAHVKLYEAVVHLRCQRPASGEGNCRRRGVS